MNPISATTHLVVNQTCRVRQRRLQYKHKLGLGRRIGGKREMLDGEGAAVEPDQSAEIQFLGAPKDAAMATMCHKCKSERLPRVVI